MAVSGIWIHALFLYRVSDEIKELIFKERYKILMEKVKKAKRTFACRIMKEAIQRHKVGSKDRALEAISFTVGMAVNLINPQRVTEDAVWIARNRLFNKNLVEIVQRKLVLEIFVQKSKNCLTQSSPCKERSNII